MKNQFRVPPATFVIVWESSETVAEAAAKLKMTPRAAGARATRYRGRGVRLRKLKRTWARSRAIDVVALNALVAQAAGRPASR